MMKFYGISLEDRQLHQYLLRNLITLNHKHKTGQENNMLPYDGVIKGNFNLVPIPRASSLGQIRPKEKYSKWISNFLYEICIGHHHNDPTRPLLEFLLYFFLYDTYQETWQEDVALNGGTNIPKIDEVATKAIQSVCNINCNQIIIL